MIKPSEITPLATLLLAKTMQEAGCPPGVLNVITTSDSKAVSAPIVADHKLRKITFTGSTLVGKILLAQSAQNVLKASMELGGNAPFPVPEAAEKLQTTELFTNDKKRKLVSIQVEPICLMGPRWFKAGNQF